jgi:LuxR family transcriptional regulator, maltose regulon positive regulatory protein
VTGSALTESADGLPPLSEAKLAMPCKRPEAIVARQRILALLDTSSAARLLLVAAPAGFGKTTAVAQWCATRPASVAWVTLDVGDNDPARLWTYAATAIDRVRQGLGRGALIRLRRSGYAVEPVIDELANGLRAFAGQILLVLDDVETVTDSECVASIGHAIDRLPENAHVVLLSRVAPPLRLAQLRARRELVEVGAADLAFTEDEARALLNGYGLGLDEEEVIALLRRTEGWPAALVLAATWLRSADDPHEAAQTFGSHQRVVADYLGEEVLAALSADTREFVMQLCVLGRFNAAMSDEVLGRTDSATLLADLERTNLLVTRVEQGDWFRIHTFLADYATAQLRVTNPGVEVRIHSRAAAWLRAQGMADLAVVHAHNAEDQDAVADILEENHLAWIRAGRSRTLLRWTETLPAHLLLKRPRLAVAAAVAATLVGHGTIARRRFLHIVDRARHDHPNRVDSYVGALDSMIRSGAVEGDVSRAVSEGRHAVQMSDQAVDEVRVAALAGLAQALYFAGDLDDAWAQASLAVEQPTAERRPLGHAFARSALALIAVERSLLPLARMHLERARTALESIGSMRSWIGAEAAAASGCLLAAEGDISAAERELAVAEQLFEDEAATLHHAWVLLLLARVRCRRGRIHAAQADLAAARSELAELHDTGQIGTLSDEVAHEVAAASGRALSGDVIREPSKAELVVLGMLDTDLSTREIAEHLHLSTNTVRSHVRAVYRKLGVRTRADAVARADALGLLQQPGGRD